MCDAKKFAHSVVTYGRVLNIIEHITRDGNEILNMKRVPDFIRELVKDIQEEHRNFFIELGESVVVYNKAICSIGVPMFKKEIENRALGINY